MALPIALFGAFAAPAVWLRYAFGGLGVALLTTFAMAQNRGAAVGLALALLCIWWNARKRWLWALSAIPLLALAMFLVPGGYIDRFRVVIDPAAVTPTAGLDRSTVDERKELWTAAGTIFVDHPLMGVGPGNSIAALKLYRPGYSRIRIHNTFIDAAIETGAVGFVLFTALIAGALFLLQRRMQRAEHADARPCLRAVQAALAAYVGICLFISRYDMQLAYLLVGWAAALVASSPALFAHSNTPRRHRKSRSKEQSAPDPTAQAAL
jgi:O-antigen ligase